jgi:hypothetical protein
MNIQINIYDAVLKAVASLITRRLLRPVTLFSGTEVWRIIDSEKDYSNIIDARCIPPKSSFNEKNRYSGLVPSGSAYKGSGSGSAALYLGDAKAVRAEARHYHGLTLAKQAEYPNQMRRAAMDPLRDHGLIDKLAFAFETRVDFELGDVGQLRGLLQTDVEVCRALNSAGLGNFVPKMLIDDDYSACLAVGHAMYNAGFEGLFAETARRHDHLIGNNVVLFGRNGQSFVEQLDPLWMLIAVKDEYGEVTVTAYPQKTIVPNRVGSANEVFKLKKG